MQIIFNKKTLKVVSTISGNFLIKTNCEKVLRSMFPDSYWDLRLWDVDKQLRINPTKTTVVLDKDGYPDSLFDGKNLIYKENREIKQENRQKELEDNKKKLSKILPGSLCKSLDQSIINFWTRLPYTLPKISSSLQNATYFQEKSIVPILWWGTFTDAGGYANMNRSIVARLHNYHILTKIEVAPTAPQVSATSQYLIAKYSSFDFRGFKNPLKIFGFTPHPHSYHGYKIFYTMMETDTLHPEFVRVCNNFCNEVWVPSTHNRNVFRSSGVKKPISIMPLGIDEAIYNDRALSNADGNKYLPGLRVITGSGEPKRFRFMSLFGWSYRKGPDILLKAFVREFKASDDVCLIIVARHCGSPAEQHVQIIMNEAKQYINSVRSSDLPQIFLYPHIVPEEDMPSLYKMANAFVATSRGEGFFLPAIEASACGLPVISCNNTGMGEYLTEDNAFLVTNKEKEICNSQMHWITHYYHGQLFPKLGKEQIKQTQEHMRYVFENYKKAKEKGAKLRDLVFEKYTWKKAAERVASRIREIC